mgnify:CR=1 FL=1
MSDFEGQAAVDAADDETSVGTAVAMDDDCTKRAGGVTAQRGRI